ncbi:MAG: ABC transporter substrate-binding protein [Pseudomonadota bacterium]
MSMKLKLAFTAVLSAQLCLAGPSFAGEQPSSVTQENDKQLQAETPDRIVAITGASNIITLDRSADRLVATSPRSRNTLLEGVLSDVFPELGEMPADVVSKEGAPNIEQMLNLETDMAIEWARKTKSVEAMKRAGIPVLVMNYSKSGMEKMFLTRIGAVLDQEPRAAEILAWQEKTHKKITSRTHALAEEDKPRVLFLLRANYAAGPSSHFQFTMDTAGARNALETPARFVEIDAEMLLNANPDVIWLMGWNPRLKAEVFLDNPVYADVPAVKHRRIYKVPVGGDHWDAPNQEFPLAWEWFTRTIHPELLDGSIRDSVRAAYPMLYGLTPSDEQLDRILRVEENAEAANYAQVAR